MKTIFRDCAVWDGTGSAAYAGDVLVVGNRIAKILRSRGDLPVDGAQVIEAGGRTLMPGLVEGHAHLSYGGATRNTDLGDLPPEEHLLLTMRNAKTLLDHGFTSAYGAASAKLRLDVVIRNEIDAGRLPGPRLRAAGPEITVTAGLGDDNRLHMARDSFGLIADGVAEITKAVRLCVREGVDNVKINISGDDFVAAKGSMTVMSEDEVRTAVEVAHSFGKRVASHSRAAESVKRALRCGVDVIYHCELADTEALDMLEANRDRVFVGPAIGLIYGTLHEAEAWGITHERACALGMNHVMENSQRTYAEMRKRGIRVVVGGDYGFAWVPQGTNARDIEHFVKLFGYTANEALQCATRIGGEIMGLGNELGLVKEGYLADLLLVDGDPIKDVAVLQNAAKLVVIMKDGALYKNALESLHGLAKVA
jgi:imidazolonepropionase-like amidohydrolase